MKRLAPIAGAAALLLAPALAACGDAEEPAYEADATDESGGELIVNDADQPGVAVDLPDTPMTNVPAGAETPEAGTVETETETETGQTTPPSE